MSDLWSVALKAALGAFSALGLDADDICREAGIARHLVDDPDARIPLRLTGRIWPLAENRWRLPGLGLWAGSAVSFGELAALDYTVATAPTVGQGVERLAGYWELNTGGATGIDPVMDPVHDQLSIRLRGYDYPQLRDYALAAVCLRLATVGAGPARAEVSGPRLAPESLYVSKLGCPVQFDAAHTAVVLAPGAHRLVVPPRYPGLRVVIEREAERLLAAAKQRKDPLASCRRELSSLIGPGTPTLDQLAERLGTSRRKLQRLLAEHDTRFPTLVDEVRCALAEQHLRSKQVNVAEIGYLLGFSEPSAFSRAFKRWTGRTPLEFRASPARGRNLRPRLR